jgi:hypothetical protein
MSLESHLADVAILFLYRLAASTTSTLRRSEKTLSGEQLYEVDTALCLGLRFLAACSLVDISSFSVFCILIIGMQPVR